MRREWTNATIGDVATIFDGPHATPTKTNNGPWYLSISSLVGGRIDLSRSAHLSQDDFPRWTKRVRPTAGDTLFSYETRLGEAAHWSHPVEAALGRRMGLLRPKAGVVDPRFLTYLFLSPEFQEQIKRKTVSGATVDRILIADLPQWPIRLPPMEEQRKIAKVLGALDDLIECDRKTARELEQLLRSTFEELKFDAPGEGSVLSDIISIDPVLPKPKAQSVPYVDMAALPTESALILDIQRRAPAGGRRFQNGDTLMARITPCLENGKTAFVDCLDDGDVGIGSTEFINLRPVDPVPPMWPYALARSPRFRDYAIKHMTGTSGRQRCSAADIENYPIALPSDAALAQFGEFARSVQTTLRELTDEVEMLTQTSAELIPLLMSGVVTLRDEPA